MENQLHIALNTNKLFEGISISNIDLSSIKGNLFTIKEGEILYREDDPFGYLYFIVSGELNLLSKHVAGDSNSVIVSANDYFGHDEYLSQSNRISTVVALRDSYIIGLTSSEIQHLIGQDERILIKLKSSCYLVTKDSAQENDLNAESEEAVENIKNTELPATESQEHQQKQSLVLNDDLDAAMVVEPENFESPEDYEERQEEFDLNNLKSDSAEEQTPTNSDIEEFKLLDDKEEAAVSTEPLGDDLHVDDLIDADDNLFLDGISSEEEMRKIDELIKSEISGDETNSEEEITEASNLVTEERIPNPLEDAEDQGNNSSDDNSSQQLTDEQEDVVKPIIESPEIISDKTVETTPNETTIPEPLSIETTEFEKTNNEQDKNSSFSTAKLDMIIKAAELVNSNIKVHDALANIVTVSADLVNADRGTLYLVEHDKGTIWSEVAMGEEVKEIHLKIGEGIAGSVAKTGKTINIADVSTDERFQSSFDKTSGYTTKSMLCMPIKNKEESIVGVLQLLNSKNGSFSELDEELLNALSIFIAISLENANLVEKLLKTERIDSLGKMTNFLIQDIKKPVLVSKRYADHLLEKELAPDIKQVLEMLDDQLNHVADLVQTTSSYSQGHSILRAIPQNINGVLTDFSHRLDSYLRTANCSLDMEFDNDAVIKIDSKEFYQCFYQIVRNAVEAMPDGGRIKLKTIVDAAEIKISFIDNGLGVNESLLDKIFEPFMTFGKKNGTGLGLSITKKLVEDHSGNITVQSSLGEGATFTITLPLANAI